MSATIFAPERVFPDVLHLTRPTATRDLHAHERQARVPGWQEVDGRQRAELSGGEARTPAERAVQR